MRPSLNGQTLVAGVVGDPVGHSLSPVLHNAWITALGLNAVYVPLSPAKGQFRRLVEGLRGGALRGLNVTLPFKEEALLAADRHSAPASAAGAANVLIFNKDGEIQADNTDGEGLLYALGRQAPNLKVRGACVVILGAGGAARGALAALQSAGAREIRIANRTRTRADVLASLFPSAVVVEWSMAHEALAQADLILNTTSAEVHDAGGLSFDFSLAEPQAVAMDMLYRPLSTRFLRVAKQQGLQTVDGLDMLIGQARPSFKAFFGSEPPASVDARALALEHLSEAA